MASELEFLERRHATAVERAMRSGENSDWQIANEWAVKVDVARKEREAIDATMKEAKGE